MPTDKALPSNWDALPAALREQALQARQQRIQTMLEQAFVTVVERTFLPRHVQDHHKAAFAQYACSNRKAQ